LPVVEIEFYATPGPLTALAVEQLETIAPLGRDPEGDCRVIR